MSRGWTQEEIQAASKAMVTAGNMSYEEVCAELEAYKKIGRFAPLQSKYNWPCPRCGQWSMDRNLTRNALSRRAVIYICSNCGMEEAMEDFYGTWAPLASWDIAGKEEWPLGNDTGD